MRKIDKIIVHCSATAEGKNFTVADITRWHKAQGWKTIGYHYVVYRDGSVHAGRDESEVGAHCSGQNANSIGVCYIGGVASDGKTPKDTRTDAQKAGLRSIVSKLKAKYPNATVYGHRDFAAKACPSFDAKKEYADISNGLSTVSKVVGVMIPFLLLLTMLCSCATGSRFVVAETVRTDTLRMISHHTDTILLRDSIRTDTRISGDTVYITKETTKWRTRLSTKTDTFYRNRQDTVVPEKFLASMAALHDENSELSNRLNKALEENMDNKRSSMIAIGVVAGVSLLAFAYTKISNR